MRQFVKTASFESVDAPLLLEKMFDLLRNSGSMSDGGFHGPVIVFFFKLIVGGGSHLSSPFVSWFDFGVGESVIHGRIQPS